MNIKMHLVGNFAVIFSPNSGVYLLHYCKPPADKNLHCLMTMYIQGSSVQKCITAIILILLLAIVVSDFSR